jgi:hypothetical protein
MAPKTSTAWAMIANATKLFLVFCEVGDQNGTVRRPIDVLKVLARLLG